MKRKSSGISSFFQRELFANSVLVVAKKITMLAVFLLAAFWVGAQTHFYHEDKNGIIRIFYEGKADDAVHFLVAIENKVEKLINLKLVDRNAVVHYNGFYRKKEVLQKIKIENPDDNKFIFRIARAGEVEPISFEVSIVTTNSDNVLIRPIAERLLSHRTSF